MSTYGSLSQGLFAAFLNSESENDGDVLRAYCGRANAAQVERARKELEALVAADEISLADLGTETNRWFGSEDEARDWLSGLLNTLEESAASAEDEDRVVVKDSNGAELQEGDSVTVIKDLKVKGGSSDLKRGTMIKGIHLTGDRDTIECRVNGSTLVLRVEFLKKA